MEHVPDFLKLESDPCAMWKYGTTTYRVHRIAEPLPWPSMSNAKLALLGPRGAVYVVRDNGPRYCVTFWNFSISTRGRVTVTTPFDRARISRSEFANLFAVEV